MKNLKIIITILALYLLFIQNVYAVYKIISLTNDKLDQSLPSSEKSKKKFNDDGTIICWLDEKNNGSLYAQKLGIDGHIKWFAGGILVDVNLGLGFTADTDYPQIFSDNKGGAIIIYTKAFTSYEEIYVQKVFANGNCNKNPICISRKFGGYNFSPSAVMTNNNNIAVAWENFDGGDFNIHAQMLDRDGKVLWNDGSEVVICDFLFDQRKPTIGCDEDNNVFVTWLDSRDAEANSEFFYELYGNVLDENGNYLNYGSKGKLIIGDDIKSLGYASNNSRNLNINKIRKELFYNHKIINSNKNFMILAVERSNGLDKSNIEIIKLDDNLENVWSNVIDYDGYKMKPLIISDNTHGANIFWDERRNNGNEIYMQRINKNGNPIFGGPGGISISCDKMKSSCKRLLPCEKNQNGISLLQNKIFFTWVNTQSNKLYLSNLNLAGESKNCDYVIELQNDVSEGEYTSVTTQRNNLVVVYKQFNDIFALVKGIDDISSNATGQKTIINNFPNPFNPSTTITFNIPSNGFVKLSVFDITGKEIQSLVNEFKSEGSYDIEFDGSNFSSGIYFYKLETNGIIQTKKMTLLK